MNLNQQAILILDLVNELHASGSWCGETHLQKAISFLKQLMKFPFNFNVTMYKHGPFSFDLRDEIYELIANGLLELEPQQNPYGPRLKTTEKGNLFKDRFPNTLGKYHEQISWLATKLGNSGVVELEQLGTAMLISQSPEMEHGNDEAIIKRIIEIKPHIEEPEAKSSLKKYREMEQEYVNAFE